MQKSLFIPIVLSLFLALTGCDLIYRRHQAGVVAEVNGKWLYEEQIKQLTAGLDSVDSVSVANRYIRLWAIGVLQYDKAMSSRSPELEEMAEDYRRQLYLHEYEQRLVARHMPKDVPDSTIERFYNEHKDQFVLNESILKGLLIVFPNASPKQNQLKQWMMQPDDENLEKIEKYTFQYASGYELFLNEWNSASQILLRLPTETDVLQQLQKQSFIEIKDSLSTYWLQVTDKRFKGEYMPVEYAKGEIKQIVLAQRQVEFLQEQRDKLYKDALRYRKIKIYENQ
jgi:hypothetical protein